MKDIKYIIKRIIIGTAIALILMLIRTNVFAQSIELSPTNIYVYEKDSNTYLNVTNSKTDVVSGGSLTWVRFTKTKYRARLDYTLTLSSVGYYTVMFSTYNEDRQAFNGLLNVNGTLYSCEGYYDLNITYNQSSTTGSVQTDLSSGSQSWVCDNVYLNTTQTVSIFLNANVGATPNHYTYITKKINFVPIQNLGQAIQQQTQQQHQDAQQQHQDMQDLNNSLNSDTTPSSSDTNNAYSGFENNLAQNGVITQLIVLPVSLFTNVLSSLNSTCTRFDMGTLLGTHIYFDCINVSNFIGSNLWSVIDILMSGFFVWYIARKLIKVFQNLSSMKEGDPIGD